MYWSVLVPNTYIMLHNIYYIPVRIMLTVNNNYTSGFPLLLKGPHGEHARDFLIFFQTHV